MKKFKLFVMTVLAISMAACGNGGKINPTSKKINGPLGKFFEVVERDYKINDDEFSVEFKRIAEGGPTNASWSTNPTFFVELQDEDGNIISKESTDVVSAQDQLEAVFSLGVDETTSITFKFDKTKGTVKFKVSSKWDEDEKSKSSDVEEIARQIHQAAYIDDPDGYTNVRKQPNTQSTVVAKIVDGEKFFFDEVPGSKWVKVYRSADADAESIGYMHSSRVRLADIIEKEDAFVDTDDNSVISSSDSEDWDELLTSYEQYVDKYISYVKKATKGDMTALAEYPSLMKKAEELSDKLERAQEKMSASQWSRYMKITMKMLEAAQEMVPTQSPLDME